MALWIHAMIPQRGGLPHSDIHGSKPARGSPWLFAACHVLRRLLVPRHPPNALLTLPSRRPRRGRPPCAETIARRGEHRSPRRDAAPRGSRLVALSTRPAVPPSGNGPRAAARNAPERSPTGRGCPRPPRGGTRPPGRTAGRGGTDPPRRARPGTHQNLIHPDKEQRRRTFRRPTGGAPPPAGTARATVSWPLRDTTFRTPPAVSPPGGVLEAAGFEPATPCLQSRCSAG